MLSRKLLLDKLYSHVQIKSPLSPAQKLSRVRDILDFFGNPHEKFKSFHITGTKGKGSTAVYLARALEKNGFKTGLFTSPHIFDERERIQIDARPISWTDLSIYLEKIFTAIDLLKKPIGFFDILSIGAFLYFFNQKIDYAVVEVGVGAQFDPTIVLHPEASIVTQIGLDHTDLLGETLEKIAATKSYIIKPKTPVYIQDQSPEIVEIFRERADSLQSPLHLCKNDDEWDLHFSNLPSFQKQNLFLVNQALVNMKMRGVLENIEDYRQLTIPGRFQLLGNVLLDVAHNPLSIDILIKNYKALVEDPLKQTVVLLYTKPQKDFETIISLFPKNWNIYFINIKNSFNTKDHPVFLNKQKYRNIKIASDLSILNEFDQNKTQILITGSFLLIENFLRNYQKTVLTLK